MSCSTRKTEINIFHFIYMKMGNYNSQPDTKYIIVEFNDMESYPPYKTKIIETYTDIDKAKSRAYDLIKNLKYPQDKYMNYWVKKE